MIHLFIFLLAYVGFSPAFPASFVIDFESAKTYIDSIKNIRESVGHRAPNIPEQYNVFTILPNTPEHQNHYVTLRNLRPYDLQVVLDQRSLYVLGYIRENVYHRLADNPLNPNPPNTIVNQLSITGHYHDLQQRAAIPGGRENLTITRESLANSIDVLFEHQNDSPHLDSLEAAAFMRIITVVSEAIRFRVIAREFATEALARGTTFRLGETNLSYERSWSPLSSVVRNVNEDNQGVRTRDIDLQGYAAIGSVLGILMACRNVAAGSGYFRSSPIQCLDDTKTRRIDGVVWDALTLDQED